MISNRQGGRRRGRGGGQPRGINPGPGNRQDNRQRGNAAQLLEKYKGMARDAQLQGDRVQTEYFLQYADHYFRVLGESRARFEEQRRQRDEDDGDEDHEQEAEMAETGSRDRNDDGDGRDERPRRVERNERQDRGERFERNGEQRRGRGPRRDAEGGEGRGDDQERIALDSLPPAIASTGSEEDREAPAPARARRPRRPRGQQDEDVAPAA
ncbi:MAG: DUF4167 domain-containing protein [Sphingomonas sp.]